MMHVVVGTDTYGRVKTVGKTAVVTMFSMAQMLPLGPLKSYYVWGTAESEIAGVPLLASVQKVTLRGVPLARVDGTSVAFAYVRAVLAALVLFGFIGTFTGLVAFRDGRPMDDFALTLTRLAQACLVTGIVGGVLSYFVPTVDHRERAIRTYCSEMLGVCIDPGRVAPEVATAIREALPQVNDVGLTNEIQSKSEYVRNLILTRCDGATGAGENCEARTDALLDQLRHLEQVAITQSEDAESGNI